MQDRRIAGTHTVLSTYMNLRQFHLNRPCIVPRLERINRRQSKVLRAFIQ